MTTTHPSPLEIQKSKIENPATLPNLTPLLPRGQLTLLIGDPAIGKSLLALDFAARISNNSPPLPHPHLIQPLIPNDQIPSHCERSHYQPANAFILCREDSPDTVLSRLYSAGANLAYVQLIEDRVASLVPLDYNNRPTSIFDFKKSQRSSSPLLLHFEHNIQKYGPTSLIILDPLPACLGIHDSHHPSTIRNLLTPLLDFAAKHHIAILGITHLTKSRRSKNPLNHILGSIAYPALARSILYLTTDPASPATRLLIPLKLSTIPITHAYSFTLSQKQIPPLHPAITNPESHLPFPIDDPDYLASTQPRIQWNAAPITNHPLLPTYAPNPTEENSQEAQERAFARSELEIAIDFLRTSLSSGPLPSTQILRQARTLDITPRTLRRARHTLQIRPHRDAASQTWLLSLPNPPIP